MSATARRTPITLPAGHPCATFFLDESSSRASGGSFFVIGGIKLKRPGRLLRDLQALRDQFCYTSEFKFNTITKGRLDIYFRVVDALAASDARLVATVVDTVNGGNPFGSGDADWQVHARVASKLLVGNLNRGEVACVVADHVSTPAGHAFDDALKGMVNKRLNATGLVSAVCADSLSSDGLQVADLVAGAVARHRKEPRGRDSSAHKAVLARRLAAAFDLPDFQADTRTSRVNVATYRG